MERAPERERARRPSVVAQALAFDVLEHEEERAVLELAEVGRGGDVRVLDVRGGHRLALEARDDLGHARHLGVEHLDRDALAHERVLGRVDRAHAALAEERVDAVAIREDHPDP